VIYERSGIIPLALAVALVAIFILILATTATISYTAYKKLAMGK
jgi:hypothetical protein